MLPPVPLLLKVKGRGTDNWVGFEDPGSELDQHMVSIASQPRKDRILYRRIQVPQQAWASLKSLSRAMHALS